MSEEKCKTCEEYKISWDALFWRKSQLEHQAEEHNLLLTHLRSKLLEAEKTKKIILQMRTDLQVKYYDIRAELNKHIWRKEDQYDWGTHNG